MDALSESDRARELAAAAAAYPAHWEADVVLADGATAHLRPITPADAELLVDFYARVSDESKYLRFFAPYPRLSDRDVARFTQVDHRDRVALILLLGDEMIAVGRYDRVSAGDAEVSFLVEDSQQGRGVASVLLEHLAAAARENGITRFLADILPTNRKMIQVFADAGYTVDNQYADGIVRVEFPITPTDGSLEVMAAREHRAEARSIERLLAPGSVAIVGASRSRDTVGQRLVRNLVDAGFTGPVYAVNPEATAVSGIPAYPSVRDIPGQVDVAVIAVPADAVHDVVLDCAAKGVRGLVVVSAGFADAGTDEGRRRQRQLVTTARAHGMRVVGPNCLGIANTDPQFSLNASLAGVMPPRGRVGLFAQSGALGTVILTDGAARGVGLSTFVSAGNRADVSGNDLMQYWRSDPATDVVLLYLESLGNPRKFARISRRLAQEKPVVAVKSGRSTQGVPLGHTVGITDLPDAALDAMFRQSGVIRTDTVSELFDVGTLLAFQPLPPGGTVAIVGNAGALCLLAADAAVTAGLEVRREPWNLGPDASAVDYSTALRDLVAADDVDSLLVVYTPAIEGPSTDDVARAIADAATDAGKPIVTTFLGTRGVPVAMRRLDEHGAAARGSVPSYPSVEEAARALGHAHRYATWRRRRHGTVPEVGGIDAPAARALVEEWLGTRDPGSSGEVEAAGEASASGEASVAGDVTAGSGAGRARVELSPSDVRTLLGHYGIDLLPMIAAPTLADAQAAAAALDGEVVLKATATHLRHRPDLADVWRNIGTSAEMRDAWETMSRTLADPAEAQFVVQPMAPGGVPVVIRAREDPMFGPVVSFGVAGMATELLGDRSYRIPPLTDVDVAEMIREVKSAPLLLGYGGGIVADVAAVEDLVHRVSCLVDDLPEVSMIELNPVLVGAHGLSVVNASAVLAPAPSRSDWYARRLA